MTDYSDNDNDPRTINDEMDYDILVSRGYTDTSLSISYDAKLSVDELGDMSLSIREGSSLTDISTIIKDNVASFIVKEFVFLSYSHANDHIEEYNNNGKSSWVESTYTLEVVITLLDKDPFSYTGTFINNNNNTSSSTSSNSKHNHHNQLYQSLSTTFPTYLHPISHPSTTPHDVSVTFNLGVYVPLMDRMPLKVKFKIGGTDKVVSYCTEFAIPERFTAVPIVNLNQPTVATGYDDDDYNNHYDKTVISRST
eukprot:CAMPEP_0198277296 /NCGR_PEP_ID=MMETSP1447-20131203/65776_1 /TAXON_ID=420782 /ORGANISM="Chaetoceros dichaeta, Strain CCMP1751" /LENGTH=252 /DNA_ID=CAMNT_0043972311 /DNA_START=188 /DNA_END=947 /DNA_ORIENTATION=+